MLRACLASIAITLLATACSGFPEQAVASGNRQRISPAVVALIDTGADLRYLYDRGNLWEKSDEIIDDSDNDTNGYVDDRFGWDFAEMDPVAYDWPSATPSRPLPYADAVSHGTLMARLIAGDKLPGTNGLALMVLRVSDSLGPVDLKALEEAVEYAVANGAQVVNLSLGGDWSGSSKLLATVVNARDTVFVLAAGNEGREVTPSSDLGRICTEVNVICVASTGSEEAAVGTRLTPSNFGARTIGIAVPGGPVTVLDRYVQAYGADFPREDRRIKGLTLPCLRIAAAETGSLYAQVINNSQAEMSTDLDVTYLCPTSDGSASGRSIDGTSVSAATLTGEISRCIQTGLSAAEALDLIIGSASSENWLENWVIDGRYLRRSPCVSL